MLPYFFGYTLIEAMVVLCIVGILTIFSGVLYPKSQKQHLKDMHKQWNVMFQVSKREAVRLARPVHFCPLSIKTNSLFRHGCSTSSSSWVDWSQGILAFADQDFFGSVGHFDSGDIIKEWRFSHRSSSWQVSTQSSLLSMQQQGYFLNHARPTWVFQHKNGICLRAEWDGVGHVLQECFGEKSSCFRSGCI
jgi:Tfp pilus assembly protein FimT